ncbi:MAG: hypothetical protein CL677_09010 [Bdellovibrionaceae bacterium]|nr:hypothetical protein [Pseudobdellovibrionaceae bacterium]
MKLLILLLSIFSINSYANIDLVKIQNIESKYLLVVENGVATQCFKSNPDSIKALKTYKSCGLTPNGRQAPLEELKAECNRGENTVAYFFDNIESCNAARLDLYENGL